MLPSTDCRPPRRGVLWESLAFFAAGVALMQFVYLDPNGRTSDRAGVPEYDSWYHLKMAALLPQIGFVDEFPWLKFVFFRQEGHAFVSHHAGFHVYLAPFVWLSQQLTGDYAAGGRWAISVSFGLSVMLLFGLLRLERVPWRWMWLVVLLVCPTDFFLRHSYIRAISPSLVCLLSVLLFVFQRRPVAVALAVAAYNLLYLGAVVFSPIVVVTFVAASLLAPRSHRSFEWRTALGAMAGWCAGVLLYPYREGVLEFLRLQIFGSGLSPDIAVGLEWRSYGEVWEFLGRSAGPLLAVWATALVLRLHWGPPLTPRATTLVVLNFVFLCLTIKAQRFVEYWPPLCLLSAAYLAAPLLRFWSERRAAGDGRTAPWLRAAGVAAVIVAAGALVWRFPPSWPAAAMLREWPTWLLMTGLLALPALWSAYGSAPRIEAASSTRLRRAAVFPLAALGLTAAVWIIFQRSFADLLPGAPRLMNAATAAGALLAVYLLAAALAWRFGGAGEPTARRMGLRTAAVAVTAVAALLITTSLAGARMSRAQQVSYCGYDLPAIRNVMACLKSVSAPGDGVFTDDWDIFPVYFYHNSHNHYIVGLDPKFTQWREPELWARYVKISRGELRDPNVTLALPDGAGGYRNETIEVRLEDIRDRFGCRFVLVDRDHSGLAHRLAEHPEFAELIYPPSEFRFAKQAPYLLFRVRENASAYAQQAQRR